jgi:hypothetical protein
VSKLILPDGVESVGDEEFIEAIPEDIMDSFNLLLFGLQNNSVMVATVKMNDGGLQQVYNLVVGIPHPMTHETRIFTIARMLPQHKKEAPSNGPSTASFQAPDSIG